MRMHSTGGLLARSFRSVGAAVLFASLACAQAGPDGHWEGTLKGDRGDIGVSLDLARNAKAQWIASMGVPPDVKGLVVTDVAVEGKSVKFTAAELMMTRFDLTLDASGILKGTYSSREGPLPVEFKRTGEAKVELIPASPAVSKELQGDWEGSLQMGNRAFRMIFHFKNQTDNTVTATIDTPDTKAMGLPLNDVKQTGQKVEFGIRVAHASFQGTLNQEGTELAGQFMHESEGVPMTLRKK
jgi:hypothetical protein